ncbi:CD3337/EF1877 family mobilome membrane protein [Enterococcus lactis]|uniref:CD3337/EF1877 family mobilome membrane protein n=1 Tax=Enterococcus lactis TaxID=357441 RepID=UPI0031CD3F1A
MKRKKKIFFFLVLFLFVVPFVVGSIAVFADGVKLQEESNLLIDKYNLDRFNSYLSSNKGLWGVFTGDTVPNAIGALANIFFTGSKILFQVFDKCIELMYSLNVIDKLNDIVGTLTNNMWGNFKGSYIPLIVIIAVLIVARTFFLESAKGALQQLAKVILVLVVAGIWFPSASEYMNKLNNYSFMFQASIMESASSTEATKGMTGGATWTENADGVPIKQIDQDKASEVATNVIRNELFKQTVYKPFLLLNYGTTEASDIDAMYQQVDDKDIPKDTSGEYLLSDDFAKLDSDDKQNVIKELAGEGEEPINYYLTADSVGYKFVIALIYLVGVLLYGLPLVAIAFCNVLLQLLAIIFSYILPIIALLSLFPKYSNGLLNSILTICKIFMGKALLGLLVLLFALVNTSIDLLIPQNTMVNALLNLFVKGVIYILAIKYRKTLIQTVVNALTTGSVSIRGMGGAFNQGRPQQAMQEQSQAFQNGEFSPHLQVPTGGEMDMPDYYEAYDPQPRQAVGGASETIYDPQTDNEQGASHMAETADVPQAEINEQIAIDDPQATTNGQTTIDGNVEVNDPQLEVTEQIDVDDPQVTVNETIDVRDPQIEQPEASIEVRERPVGATGTNEPVVNQQLHLHQHQGNVVQTNTQQTDVDQTLTTQNEYNSYHETFENRLEELRG